MTMADSRDTRTASQAYAENMEKIRETLKKLKTGLRKHQREQAKDPRSYGYPGDLSYVADLLEQAARFICGEEE